MSPEAHNLTFTSHHKDRECAIVRKATFFEILQVGMPQTVTVLVGIRQIMGPDLSSSGLTGKIAAAGYTGHG